MIYKNSKSIRRSHKKLEHSENEYDNYTNDNDRER